MRAPATQPYRDCSRPGLERPSSPFRTVPRAVGVPRIDPAKATVPVRRHLRGLGVASSLIASSVGNEIDASIHVFSRPDFNRLEVAAFLLARS
jgi:hypothetical protein